MKSTIGQYFIKQIQEGPDAFAQLSKDSTGHFQPITYQELGGQVAHAAAGYNALGISRGDKVGIISENRKEWLENDLSLMVMGAVDVPRGIDSTDQEIEYIVNFSGCKALVMENKAQMKRLEGLASQLKEVKFFVVLHGDKEASKVDKRPVYTWQEVKDLGQGAFEDSLDYLIKLDQGVKGEDLATLIFTSGTTGTPKGVMLRHNNFIFQAENLDLYVPMKKIRALWLSVLPVWHVFERTVSYAAVLNGGAIAYSKPIGRQMLLDFAAVNPTYLASVPRIWTSIMEGVYRNIKSKGLITKALFHGFLGIARFHSYCKRRTLRRYPRLVPVPYLVMSLAFFIPYILMFPLRFLGEILVFSKIKGKFGKNFKAGVSGGGAMPPKTDKFFTAIGVTLVDSYGLTETSPGVSGRNTAHPIPGTVGQPMPGTSVEIRDEQGRVCPPGEQGVIFVKGPQVMQGYYHQPEMTAAVLDQDGWFNTGDLGIRYLDGELKITGRAKDTIVLTGGENIEPTPMEDKLCESDYIERVVVLGQDQKFLAALVVPNYDELRRYADDNHVPYLDVSDLLEAPEIQELYSGILYDLISNRNGFKSFERIFRFKLLSTPFTIGKELSAKQENKRHEINKIYHKEIEELFS